MKSVACALLLLIAGSTALPQDVIQKVEDAPKSTRFVEDIAASVLESISESLQNYGLDPLVLNTFNFEYALPVPSLFNFNVVATDVQSTGISNIVIHNINFGILSRVATFDISLPEIFFSVNDLDVTVNSLGNTLTAGFSGSLKVRNPGISGRVQVGVGIISGVTVRDLSLNLYLDGIDSEATRAEFMGRDYTRLFNHLLSDSIPNTLNEYSDDINEMLELIVWAILDEVL